VVVVVVVLVVAPVAAHEPTRRSDPNSVALVRLPGLLWLRALD
jgi:hypothetical protein